VSADTTLEVLARLVVKQGVALGGLSARERELALALAARAFDQDAPASEAEVNRALKACLAREAGFLGTDHVELRRWLVDAGWWQRDGFGREYRRVPLAALPAPMRALVELLAPLDLPTWTQARRDEWAARREARQATWNAARAGQAVRTGGTLRSGESGQSGQSAGDAP
jgi:Uncharacterized protein conserved in bacteria (DUF2087)